MSILIERHKDSCSCSYCNGDYKLRFGLNIPHKWLEAHSWFVIKLPYKFYFRWTNPWLMWIFPNRPHPQEAPTRRS